jgi:hypothetical protein
VALLNCNALGRFRAQPYVAGGIEHAEPAKRKQPGCDLGAQPPVGDRETSLMEDNGQLGSCRDSMRTKNEAHSICGSRVVFSTAHHLVARLQ